MIMHCQIVLVVLCDDYKVDFAEPVTCNVTGFGKQSILHHLAVFVFIESPPDCTAGLKMVKPIRPLELLRNVLEDATCLLNMKIYLFYT